MRKSFAAILVVCFCSVFFQACSEKVLLENFNMKQRTFSSVKLSSFIGDHRLFSIKQTDSISINSPLNILKRNHHLYILSGQQCFQFDRNGVFIKKLDFSHLFNNRTAKLNGADIYIIGNQIQLWIGVQQNIHCFSFDEEKEILRIPVEIPFSNFKRISDNTILLPTIDNYYLLAICNTSGKIKDYGLPQKANVFIEGNYSFIQYGEITISQYSSTTLASYYDQESDKLKEILLVKENDYVNTWQKQTELINKYGIIKGFNTASNNYSSILHLSKPKETFAAIFKDKSDYFFSIKRKEDTVYRTMQIIPDNKSYFKNDILPIEDFGLKMRNSFYDTDSDDSLLFYFLLNHKDVSSINSASSKQKELVLLEIY